MVTLNNLAVACSLVLILDCLSALWLPLQGDSGGPIQCKQGSVWVQAGITSFGTSLGCAIKDFPEVYARVSEFNTFVTDNIQGAAIGLVPFKSNGTDGSFTCSATLHFSLYSSFIILFTALISNFLSHLLVTSH